MNLFEERLLLSVAAFAAFAAGGEADFPAGFVLRADEVSE